MKNDNIIKIARDLDKNKKYSLSNELVLLFEKMSSVSTGEEYKKIYPEYESFMKRLKESDSAIHNRLQKTAAFRWWDRLGDWFSGTFKGPSAREERIRQRVTDKPGSAPGLQQGMTSKETYKAVINEATSNGEIGKNISDLSKKINQYQSSISGIENYARQLASEAQVIYQGIKNTIESYKGRKNRNDVDIGLLMESIMNPLQLDLESVIKQTQNPRFDGNYSKTVSYWPERLTSTYQNILSKGEDTKAQDQGTESVDSGKNNVPPPTAPSSPSSSGTKVPPMSVSENSFDKARVQDPKNNQNGIYDAEQQSITWDDGSIETGIDPEKLRTQFKVLPMIGENQQQVNQQAKNSAENITQQNLIEVNKKADEIQNKIQSQDKSVYPDVKTLFDLIKNNPNTYESQFSSAVLRELYRRGLDFNQIQRPELTDNKKKIDETYEDKKYNNLDSFFLDNGVNVSESQDFDNLDDFLNELSSGPTSGSILGVNGKPITSKEEYIDQLKTQLSSKDGTLYSVVGKSAPILLAELIAWQAGNLDSINKINDYLSSLKEKDLNKIINDENPFARMVAMSNQNHPNQDISRLMEF